MKKIIQVFTHKTNATPDDEDAEDYLNSCVQGEGANEVVSLAEAYYALQIQSYKHKKEIAELKEGIKNKIYSELISIDVDRFINSHAPLQKQTAIQTVQLMEVKHKKEMEEFKDRVKDVLDKVIYGHYPVPEKKNEILRQLNIK